MNEITPSKLKGYAENSISGEVYKKRLGLLSIWRDRYEKDIYPRKIVENQIYETLTTIEMWEEIKSYFNQFNLSGQKDAYRDFEDAHRFVYNRRRQVQLNKIHPIISKEYDSRGMVGDFNLASARERVALAQKGDNKQVEELEYGYHYYCIAHENIYVWAAFGLMGFGKEDAYYEVADMIIGGINFLDFHSVEFAFCRNAGLFLTELYSPLEPIW